MATSFGNLDTKVLILGILYVKDNFPNIFVAKFILLMFVWVLLLWSSKCLLIYRLVCDYFILIFPDLLEDIRFELSIINVSAAKTWPTNPFCAIYFKISLKAWLSFNLFYFFETILGDFDLISGFVLLTQWIQEQCEWGI